MVRESSRRQRRILVALNLRYSWERSVFRGISRFANEHREWSLWPLYSDFAFTGDDPTQPVRWRTAREYDGALGVFHSHDDFTPVRERADFAVNTVGWDAEGAPPYVEIDDHAVGVMAADYFLARGFREFAYCTVSAPAKFALRRQEGFVERLRERGVTAHVWASGPEDPTLEAWLHRLPKPVAVFAGNDLTGARVAKDCVEEGIRVPNDVAVLGVDNDETICLFGGVPLSSIMVPHERLGYLAAQMLDRLMRDESTEGLDERLPPLHIITRISTEHRAVQDDVVVRALEMIRERLHMGLRVDDIVSDLKINRRSLERRFLSEMGHTPAQEISRARLERAKELLLTTLEPVEVVAERAGYVESRTFLRNFRRVYGMTPTEFRQRNESSL